jgi:hypothetical protein
MFKLLRSWFSSSPRLLVPDKRIPLPEVTLLIYNPEKDPDLSAKVINHACSGIDFGAIRHLTGARLSARYADEDALWDEARPAFDPAEDFRMAA